MVPLANPAWLQFVSHKVGRLVVPYALVTLLVSNSALAGAGLVYSLALTLQVAFYVLALHGATVALSPAAPRPLEARAITPAGTVDASSRERKELLNA
jgi:hypothetical protein